MSKVEISLKHCLVFLVVAPIFMFIFGCTDATMYDMASMGYGNMASDATATLAQRQAAAASALYANEARRTHDLNVA